MKRKCLDQNSLKLSSSANSSASLLTPLKILLPDAVESTLRMADQTTEKVKLHNGDALGLVQVEMCQAFQTLRCKNVATAHSLVSCCSRFLP